MISIYISEKKVQVISGKDARNRVKINELYSQEVTSDVPSAINALLGKLKIKEKKIIFVVDGSNVSLKTREMPCVPEKMLHKTIEKNGIIKGIVVESAVDKVLDVINKNNRKRFVKTANVSFLPISIGNDIATIMETTRIEPKEIIFAQNCLCKVIENYDIEKLADAFVVINYKKTFATVALFSSNGKTFVNHDVYNISFEEDNPDLAFDRVCNISHRGIMELKQFYNKITERIYLVGDMQNKEEIETSVSTEVGVKVEQLPYPTFIKGTDTAGLDSFICLIGSFINK